MVFVLYLQKSASLRRYCPGQVVRVRISGSLMRCSSLSVKFNLSNSSPGEYEIVAGKIYFRLSISLTIGHEAEFVKRFVQILLLFSVK